MTVLAHRQLLLAAIAAGGAGAVSSRPQAVQNGGKFGSQNFSGAQTYHMGSNFTAGNDVLVCTNHWHASAVSLSGVTVNGTTATLIHTGVGSTALLQYWLARNVSGGGNGVVITPTSGSGHYLTANAIEISPIDTTAIDVFAESNATSTTPGSTVTTATTTQCEELVYACWRDDSGVVNSAPVTPSGYTLAALETDGVNTQGGAMAYKLVQRLGTQNATFGCTSTNWYETTAALPFKPPMCILSSVTKQDWNADTNWNPTTLASTTVSGEVLISVAGAWNDSGNRPWTLPTDNNGTFTATINPTISGPEDPVNVQFCHQATPSATTHTVTPPTLANGGDGYIALIRLQGINTSSPIRDTGRARNWHSQHTAPDPATIQTLTISTTGTAAQVGDLAIIALVMDPSTVTNSDVQFVPPAGWFVLVNKFNLTDNIGFIVLAGKVVTAGQISATITWTDNATFVADAGIVVYAHL